MILGGVFNSGVLAGLDAPPTFDYEPASADVIERVAALRELCDSSRRRAPGRGIAVRVGAPAVSTVVVGARCPAEIRADVEWLRSSVGSELRTELEALA